MGYSHHEDEPTAAVFTGENNESAFEKEKKLAITEMYEDNVAGVRAERQPDENTKAVVFDEGRAKLISSQGT